MNASIATQANKKADTQASNKVKLENSCKNIANSLSTFNQMLANISNKLALSKAIYQK